MDAGQGFGRYELLSRIAMGGMAEIFLARETGLAGFERPVIIKRVLPGLSEDMDFIDMFLDEARLAARLTHPNIVHIYELGEEKGSYYIAMEYVPGGDLHELLRRRAGRLLPLSDSLHVIGEVCAGLQFAHALAGPDGEPLGVVHRDVTPKNVLLSMDGVIKVVDFGIAKARAKLSVTRPGDIKGTFSYMAPEQARGERVDRRADIYAVGALTYRLVTGTPAYPQVGESLLSAVRASQFVRPRKINPDLPPAIEDIILRAMAYDPRDRYPTCGALRRDVFEVARQLEVLGDAESIGMIVREGFPEVVGVTAPIGRGAAQNQAKATSVETPMREAMAIASPEESTGLVSFGDPSLEAEEGGTLEEFSPYDVAEEDQTDMLLLPDDLRNGEVVELLPNAPTNLLVPDHLGRPTPAPAQRSLIDLFEPPTARSDPPAVGPLPGARYPSSPAIQGIGPAPQLQPFAVGLVGPAPAPQGLPYGGPGGYSQTADDAPTSALELPPAAGPFDPRLPFPTPPPGFATRPGVVVEPAVTPTGTDIVPGRKGRRRSRRGITLIVAGFALGVVLIASALILILLPNPATSAQANTSNSATEPGGSGVDPSLIASASDNSTASLISSSNAEVQDSAPPSSGDAGMAAIEAAPSSSPPPVEPPPPEVEPPVEPPPPPPVIEERPPTKTLPPEPPPREITQRQPRDESPRVVKISSTKTTPPAPPPEKREPTPRESGTKTASVGYITIFTVPSSKVYLGGKLIGNSPIAKREVPAGRHTIKMVSDTGSKTVSVQVKAGENARIRESL